AFWMLTVYVACGLGLLMTTCFLGLRRYLRQKGLRMPAKMTATWLTVGGGLVLALVLVGAFLPRPYPEYPLLEMVGAKAPKRKASDYAMKGGPAGEGQGRPGARDPDGKKPGQGDPARGKGDPADKDGKGTQPGKGEGKGEEGKGGG